VTESTTADTSSSTNGESSGDLPVVCETESNGDACAACTSAQYCSELAACFADPICACVVQCADDSQLPPLDALLDCSQQCNMGGLNILPLEATLLQGCRADHCASDCS
jgi:hypothetical protein